ncbi:aromatic ring-hydroxylating oxygenase subunit alpha [Kyrpidia tusciae]|uniref:Aromatic-ring-hydroxylating dioxygenase, alpha subunit-like protein n=1 Tax=Kyrpidia tusciae (strain DSM 2912 / NBRC 15312 / T2) TaxID=562970 RepID=D5WVJ7_KYRT2|nr:aromatic ring-hydroxylating dioxygenase subunit alpha [Kyrpidia tusciae]ADG07540.1 Aromatic-ring-hydroxylating dioxygenase, alpha subunit-like protein [Kyrpidia tusciae DSM 2912]
MIKEEALTEAKSFLLQANERFTAYAQLLPALFSDHMVYELEKEKIFGRSWVFLAHDSEIPHAGDYVVRYIADDSFIVGRAENGEVHVLYNMCRHRGMELCRSECGNATFFRCPYHGWTYKNTGELIGVPFQREVYGEEGLNKNEWPLVPAPRVASIYGLIFANLDPEAPPLDQWLGDAKFYLDFYFKKSLVGMEVVGGPQRWIFPSNWKLGADNFVGDAYHTAFTHRSTVEVGILGVPDANFHKDAPQVIAGPWGGGYVPNLPYQAMYPESLYQSMRQNLTASHHAIMDRALWQSHSTLFPNLSFLNAPGVPREGRVVPYLTVRVWRPLGPDRMEIWSWLFVEKDAPEEFKKDSYKSYVLTFGTSGTLEQDDAENWSSITKVSKGMLAKRTPLNYSMGLKKFQPLSDWPGPGTAYPIDYTEYAQRHWWKLYFEKMIKE